MTELKKLGKYEIIEELGRGGFSVVYRAADTTLHDRPVALKVLHPHLLVDPNFVARFKQEAGVAANLRHPNIVTIHDIGEAEGWLFIAMELVTGQALDDLIEDEGPLPLERAVLILQQIAAALDHAHERDIIHRDVKPGNILVEPAGRTVLTDFGLVKAAERTVLTASGQILGTPEYMSPEQVELEEGQEPDWRTDLYALGVVAYEMLTGRVPFQARSPSAVLYKHVHEPPPPPLEVNPALLPAAEPVLLKALAKRPEERYQSGAEMVATLRAAQVPAVEETKPAPTVCPLVTEEKHPAPTPVEKKPAPQPRPAHEPIRRWPLMVGLGAVLSLVILATVAGLVMLAGMTAMGGGQFTSTPLPTTITWEKDGKKMILVPAGEFLMGSSDAQIEALLRDNPNWKREWSDDERPQHTVYLDAFYIDETEVTNTEFCRFLNEKGSQEGGGVTWFSIDGKGCQIVYNGGRYEVRDGYADHPVVQVTWYGTRAYAQWAGKRLPTEAEWEKAARGIDGWVYPWGNTWDPAKANTSEGGSGGTRPVDSYLTGASPYGCLSMAGNVKEWTSSLYRSYPYRAKDGRETLSSSGYRMLRGGSWSSSRGGARCSERGEHGPDGAGDDIGFRCVAAASL